MSEVNIVRGEKNVVLQKKQIMKGYGFEALLCTISFCLAFFNSKFNIKIENEMVLQQERSRRNFKVILSKTLTLRSKIIFNYIILFCYEIKKRSRVDIS